MSLGTSSRPEGSGVPQNPTLRVISQLLFFFFLLKQTQKANGIFTAPKAENTQNFRTLQVMQDL